MSSQPEPEWDDAEREWMLALEHYRTEVLCPCGCGWAREVSLDPMTEMTQKVVEPTRCHIRTAMVKAQQDGTERPVPEALLWSVRLAPAPTAP